MSKNIVIDGRVYNDVPSIQVKSTDGSFVTFGDSNLQELTRTFNTNVSTTITPESGYNGLSKVNINVNVPTGTDVSDTTATPLDVAQGKYFYTSDGVRLEGYISDNRESPLELNLESSQSTYDTANNKLNISIPRGNPNGVIVRGGTAQNSLSIQNTLINMAAGIISMPAETTSDKIVSGNTILGIIGTGGASTSSKPYVSFEKLDDYLYRVKYDELAEDSASDLPISGAGCSSFVKDEYLYTNLDWDYSEVVSFNIICDGFEGMAFLSGLTKDSMDDTLIGQLPYHIRDGKNDSGIRVATHVLFNDWDWQGTGDIPLTKVPYLILKNITSLENFSSQMEDILSDVYAPQSMTLMEYLIQIIVTDGTTTYCIMPPESSSGSYIVQDISSNPKLTNFRWVSDSIVDRADLQNRPTGVERWNLIDSELNPTLEDLRFTRAYVTPDRLSEFIGIDGTDKDSSDSELMIIYNKARAEYNIRTRDGKTWQTMHSAVYSADKLEHLYVQEDFETDYADHSQINLQDKTVISNGEVTADPGYDGLGTVTVNVPTATSEKYSVCLKSSSSQSQNASIYANQGYHFEEGEHFSASTITAHIYGSHWCTVKVDGEVVVDKVIGGPVDHRLDLTHDVDVKIITGEETIIEINETV